jgi:hypothetical protein
MSSGWRARLGFVVYLGAAALSTNCERSKPPGRQTPEEVWLSRIGTGPAQTARVCGHGARDRVATTLCAKPAPTIHGFDDLYRVLRLDHPVESLPAATVHSLGLSARFASGLNPRVLVYQDISHKRRPVTYEELVVAGFTRGEQLIELAALDPATYDYNFYLFRFGQACNRTRCTPEDLLTAKVESGWTDWTLYSERDLEDTPLDCVSCHLPFGPGTHKQLLMRQVFDPWMHWGDFRGGDERKLCPEQPADGTAGKVVVVADGLDLCARSRAPRPLRRRTGGQATRGEERGAVRQVRRGRRGADPRQPLSSKRLSVRAGRLPDPRGVVRALPHRHQRDLGSASARVARSRAAGSVLRTRRRGRRPPRRAARRSGRVSAASRGRRRLRCRGLADGRRRRDRGRLPAPTGGHRARDPARDVRPLSHRRDRSAPAARPVQRRGDRPRQPGDRDHDSPEAVAAEDVARAHAPLRVGELPRWAIARIDSYLRDHCTDPGGC